VVATVAEMLFNQGTIRMIRPDAYIA